MLYSSRHYCSVHVDEENASFLNFIVLLSHTECFSIKQVSLSNRTTAHLSSTQGKLIKTKMRSVIAVITAHITAIQTRLTQTKMEKAMLVQLILMVMVRDKLSKYITGNSPNIPLLIK